MTKEALAARCSDLEQENSILKAALESTREHLSLAIEGLLDWNRLSKNAKYEYSILIADGVDWLACKEGPWKSLEDAKKFANAKIGKPWVIMCNGSPVLIGSIWTK